MKALVTGITGQDGGSGPELTIKEILMKIIFPRYLTTQYHGQYDGGCKFIQQLAEGLVKRGHEVEIVTTKFDKNTKSEYYNGVKYVFLGPLKKGGLIPFNLYYKMIFSANLNFYLKKINFDVLHTTEMFSYFYSHNKKRKPIIFQSWSLEPFYGAECMAQTGLRKIYVNWFLKRPWLYCMNKANRVTANANFEIPRTLELGIEENKIVFIPNAIPYYDIRKHDPLNKRKDLGFKEDDTVFISVSQLVEDKGLIEMFDAYKMLRDKGYKAKLIIIGKGPLEDYLKDKINVNNYNNDVIMDKDISEEELYDYYYSSDFFINATRTDSYMINIQEAMACGLPIISSAQEYLVDESNGIITGINNPENITKAMIKMINRKDNDPELIKEMGKNSIEEVEKYDWSKVIDNCIKIYGEVIDR
jgi:glycosyltransferase involved in cell wall biosynthesis